MQDLNEDLNSSFAKPNEVSLMACFEVFNMHLQLIQPEFQEERELQGTEMLLERRQEIKERRKTILAAAPQLAAFDSISSLKFSAWSPAKSAPPEVQPISLPQKLHTGNHSLLQLTISTLKKTCCFAHSVPPKFQQQAASFLQSGC